MLKKFLSVLLVAIFLLVLVVSSVMPASASNYRHNLEFAPNSGLQSVSLDESDNGKSITMYVGESLSVSLDTFGGVPVFWQLEPYNTSVLELVDSYNTPPSMPGGPVTDVWVFEAIDQGTSQILLEYRTLSGELVDSFNVTVNVGPAKGVGGEVRAVNKTGMLTPWLLGVFVLIIGGAIVGLRWRPRSSNR